VPAALSHGLRKFKVEIARHSFLGFVAE